MEVKTQTVEQFLFEQLKKVAPGKYTLAGVLQLFAGKLRFACNHLKGGGRKRWTTQKDYNLSIFTFPNGVTEVKCLYNCGLKIRSDEKELTSAFNELYDLPSSNSKASAEWRTKRNDPGPAPVYSDEYRQCVRESNDRFMGFLTRGVKSGSIEPDNPILGGIFPHPDPIEAPESILEHSIKNCYVKGKLKKIISATTVVQDSIPANKIRKARKTQSRQRKRSGK